MSRMKALRSYRTSNAYAVSEEILKPGMPADITYCRRTFPRYKPKFRTPRCCTRSWRTRLVSEMSEYFLQQVLGWDAALRHTRTAAAASACVAKRGLQHLARIDPGIG